VLQIPFQEVFRHLDHKNLPKIHSQKGLGALGNKHKEFTRTIFTSFTDFSRFFWQGKAPRAMVNAGNLEGWDATWIVFFCFFGMSKWLLNGVWPRNYFENGDDPPSGMAYQGSNRTKFACVFVWRWIWVKKSLPNWVNFGEWFERIFYKIQKGWHFLLYIDTFQGQNV